MAWNPPPPPSAAPNGQASHVFGDGVAHFGADELEAITRALAEVVVPLSTNWSELLGHEVEVTIGDVRPGPLPRPADAEPDPTASILDGLADPHAYIAIGAFGADLGTAALIIPTALGLVVVDLLLGGSGRPAGERALSAIDLDLLRTVTAPTFSALRRLGAADRFDEPVPVLTDLEEADLSARLAAGVAIDVMVTIGEHTQPLIVVLGPAAARLLAGSAVTTTAAAPAESRAILASVLADVVVEAIVTFPSVQVPSHRILALDVGDVIGLGADPDAVLPLRVDGLHLADVRPARAGSDVACQIVSTAVTTSRNSGKHSVSSPTGPSAPGGLL